MQRLPIALPVLVLVLATAGSDTDGTEPVRVAPSSAPLPPSAAERGPSDAMGRPGMRP